MSFLKKRFINFLIKSLIKGTCSLFSIGSFLASFILREFSLFGGYLGEFHCFLFGTLLCPFVCLRLFVVLLLLRLHLLLMLKCFIKRSWLNGAKIYNKIEKAKLLTIPLHIKYSYLDYTNVHNFEVVKIFSPKFPVATVGFIVVM